MIIKNIHAFEGQHCETTATGTLLNQIGIELSEPMLFGLGEGLGYIFWNMKIMDFPFIGGRVKPDILTENICRNLNLKLEISQTTSPKKAWDNVTVHLKNGKAVGLKLDCYHLDYFSSKFHFAGHYAAIYGFDDKYAYLIDTKQQGTKVKTSLKSLALARNEKGPMSSPNRTYTISKNKSFDIKKAIKTAILNNTEEFLNPPITNISYKGIYKTASEIKKWFATSKSIKRDFETTAMLMERAGTGGSLFRNLYRDFLSESAELLNSKEINLAHLSYKAIAEDWKQVSELFLKVGQTEDESYIKQASELLIHISEKEKNTMQQLNKAVK